MAGSVRKRGDKWYYSFETAKVGGKRRRIERVGGRTKKEAESALRKALEEYENTGRHFEPSSMSLSDYLDYWFANYVEINCRVNTRILYILRLNKIKPRIGHYNISSLTPSILQRFVLDLLDAGHSRSMTAGIMSTLSSALQYAVLPSELIKSNPAIYVKIPREEKVKNKSALTPEDIGRILDFYPFGNDWHIPFLIGYYTGMRSGEVSALTWDNIDLENKIIRVEHTLVYYQGKWYMGQPKTRSSQRQLIIGSKLAEALIKHRQNQLENANEYGEHYIRYYEGKGGVIIRGSGICDKPRLNFVCTHANGNVVTSRSLVYASIKARKELNLNFSFHSLRHTHATLLIGQGINPKAVQDRLGHTTVTMTLGTYTHTLSSVAHQAVEIFENLPTT